MEGFSSYSRPSSFPVLLTLPDCAFARLRRASASSGLPEPRREAVTHAQLAGVGLELLVELGVRARIGRPTREPVDPVELHSGLSVDPGETIAQDEGRK